VRSKYPSLGGPCRFLFHAALGRVNAADQLAFPKIEPVPEIRRPVAAPGASTPITTRFVILATRPANGRLSKSLFVSRAVMKGDEVGRKAKTARASVADHDEKAPPDKGRADEAARIVDQMTTTFVPTFTRL
jgi:hypothetical protein